MQTQEIITLVAMIAYLVMVVVVGIMASKNSKTAEQFYLGGRGMGPWITAMSAEASDMSGWLLMGLPGLAYASGLADAGWTAIGLAIGTYLNWKVIALRLRSYTVVVDCITVPDFFSSRYHDKRKILMSLSALFILLFFIVYTSSGFVACGKLFVSLFGFPYLPAMLASAGVILIYTVVGGFLAESTVDFIQGIIMFVSLIAVVAIGVGAVGGPGTLSASANSLDGYLSLFTSHNLETGDSEPFGIYKILSGLAWGLGYVGMPHVLLRFMAIRDGKELKKSRIIGTTWCFISLAMAVLIGMIGRALYPEALSGNATENIFILMCKNLLSGGALPIIGGVMLSGILAAQISTSDSQLLLASSAVSQNFYQQILNKKATDKQIMIVARATILVVAAAAILLALDPDSSVFGIVSFAWAGFGATFGPVIAFSLYWKRANLPGAIAGMLAGGITVLVWKLGLSRLGGVFSIYELLPAFILSSIAIVVVSVLTAPPSDEICAEFDKARAMSKQQA